MRRKLLSILVLSIVITSTSLDCGQGQPAASPAIFATGGGNVSVMKAGTTGWVEAEVGMCLEPGDCIKCGGNSSAEITFLDGSTVEIEAGTQIEVASLDILTDADSATIRLKQTMGTIIFRVTKIVDPASRYEVETPTGVVAVRGSAVQITVIEDGTTWVCNLEGEIWAIAQGVELQIPEGRCCVIRPGQPPELINDAPTDIGLDNSSLVMNLTTVCNFTVVGNFSTTDPDIGDTFTYTLVSGTGDTDNGSFNIWGSSLRTMCWVTYELKGYSIRVRSTDRGGLWVEKQFAIVVTCVSERPVGSASSNSPVCENATIQLYGGPNGMWHYSWTGPGGWTSSLQNPIRIGAAPAMAGTYTLTVINSDGCSDNASTSVTVNTKPTATASSNSPVCEAATIQLYAGSEGNVTYSWTGPGGWTSSLRNPTRPIATPAMAGTYTLTVINSDGCSDNAGTSVTVNARPTATASSNSPVSPNLTIELYGGPNGMTTYSWTGPGNWTSSLQNPTRPIAAPAMAGIYTLTVINSDGCSDDESTTVTVCIKPTATASSNSPVCEAATIQLYGGPNGMWHYSWTGPGGWTSSLQNPARPGATAAMAGIYTLTVTNNMSCTGNASTSVTVNTKPTATASSNSPVSQNLTIQLYGGPNGMTIYSWTGPGNWTSSLQNPTRPIATPAMAGNYTLTVINSSNCTDYASTDVVVN